MYDQGRPKHVELEEIVKMLQREKAKKEGQCEEEDVAMGEGGVQANEAAVLKEIAVGFAQQKATRIVVPRRSARWIREASEYYW